MENKQTTGKIALTYGLIGGLISIAFNVMIWSMDMLYDQNPVTGVIGFLIMAGVVIAGIIVYKKANGGFITLKEALKVGTGTALIVGVLSVLYTLVLVNVLEPDFAMKNAETTCQVMIEQNPTISDEQLDMIADNSINYFWITYPSILIFSAFIGFIISLIVGLIVKKAKPE